MTSPTDTTAPAEANTTPEPSAPPEAPTAPEPSSPADVGTPIEPNATPEAGAQPAPKKKRRKSKKPKGDQQPGQAAQGKGQAPQTGKKSARRGKGAGTPGTQAEANGDGRGRDEQSGKVDTAQVKAIVERIGTSSEQALTYVLDPDPQLQRMGRKTREALIPELPPATAAALLGPAALARHFVASSAAGRYRDLFGLWELFRARPEDCKPVLAERPIALDKAQRALRIAVTLGLRGHAERVAEDVGRAQGLVWQWLRAALDEQLELVARRPAVASALLEREPDLVLALPDAPDDAWLREAVAARSLAPLVPSIEARLAANLHRLPATISTLSLAAEHFPEEVPALLDRVDLDAPEVGSILAWARDHGHAERMRDRVLARIEDAAREDRAAGLALWAAWRARGVDAPLPTALRAPTVEGLELDRPETASLVALLIAEGASLQPQELLDKLAAENRQRAEKAYEAFVCAGLPVQLPPGLTENPIVKEGTRCPACQAWTWVRPGHEQRCPRLAQPA